MPDNNNDATNAAAVSGSAQVLGSAITAAAQSNLNHSTQQWNEKMYNIQRVNGLVDTNFTNEYNSPQAQMKRLKIAGLNPNLVYGNGNAITTAAPTRSVDAPAWHPEAPKIDLTGVGTAAMGVYDLRLKQSQTNNVEAATTVALQDAALKAAQTKATLSAIPKTEVETEGQRILNKRNLSIMPADVALADANLQNALANLPKLNAETSKIQADTQFTHDANDRAQGLYPGQKAIQAGEIWQQALTRGKTAAETQNIYEQIANAERDGTLKDYQNKLNEAGIQPTDPFYIKAMNAFFPGGIQEHNKNVVRNVKLIFDNLMKGYSRGH